MRRAGDSRSLTHFELEEALGLEGCAICRLVSRAARGYLDNLMYELVNDPEVQGEFRDSLGFCNRHAYQTLDAGDGLGMSILYGVAVQELRKLLSEVPEAPRSRKPLAGLLDRSSNGGPALLEPGTGCMVCGAEDRAEERYLAVLLEGAGDGSLEVSLDRPGEVCVRHLSRASALAGGSLPLAL